MCEDLSLIEVIFYSVVFSVGFVFGRELASLIWSFCKRKLRGN